MKEVALVNCEQAKAYIHELMDGELDPVSTTTRELRQHLRDCRHCGQVWAAYERAEAMVRSLRPAKAPDGLKERILASLPPQRRHSLLRWVRRHPAIAVAAMFVVVMVASLVSMWHQDDTLVVKVDDHEQVVINGREVIVPAGKTVHGNLTVENGNLRVDGAVEGDLVVIDGNVLQASTAQISGEVVTVNQMIDWVWYKVNRFFESLAIR
jgi:anti-sigma factor RsiW